MGFMWKSLIARSKLLAAVLLLSLATQAVAAEKIAVVSVRESDKLFSDIEYLLDATGMGTVTQFFMPSVKNYFQGIDGSQPIGVMVSLEGQQFIPLGFVPVTDLPTVLKNLEEQFGEPVDAGNGIKELRGPQPLFILEKAGWAYLAQSPDALANVPAQPAALLEGLNKQYDISVKLFVENVPEPYKQMIVGQLREKMRESDEADADTIAKQTQSIEQALNDAETVTIGIQIDANQQELFFDVKSVAKAGTKMQQQIAATQNARSDYGGFLIKDAAIRGNIFALMQPEQIEQTVAAINSLETETLSEVEEEEELDAASREATKELVKTFFEIGRSTVKTGRLDTCTSVVLKPNQMTILSGGHVAKGSDVEAAAKKLVEISKNEEDFSFSTVKLNLETVNGVNLHMLGVPVPEEQYARKLFGDELTVIIGTGAESVYIGVGNDSLAQVKQQIGASQKAGTSVDPFSSVIELIPILKFAESIEPNPIIRSLTANIEDTPDQIIVRYATENDTEAHFRFTLQEGVIRLIGQGVQMVGIGGGF